MDYYGIRGRDLAWFESYLTNWIQICKVDQITSIGRTVKYGILQSSNLGPLLFLLYKRPSELSIIILGKYMLADDTNISTQR
jgi:hypothetical protein